MHIVDFIGLILPRLRYCLFKDKPFQSKFVDRLELSGSIPNYRIRSNHTYLYINTQKGTPDILRN